MATSYSHHFTFKNCPLQLSNRNSLDPLGAQATGIITGDVAKLESTVAQLASDLSSLALTINKGLPKILFVNGKLSRAKVCNF